MDAISKKLSVKEKKLLLTQKRVEERKRTKQYPIIIKSLYGIMGIKVPKI